MLLTPVFCLPSVDGGNLARNQTDSRIAVGRIAILYRIPNGPDPPVGGDRDKLGRFNWRYPTRLCCSNWALRPADFSAHPTLYCPDFPPSRFCGTVIVHSLGMRILPILMSIFKKLSELTRDGILNPIYAGGFADDIVGSFNYIDSFGSEFGGWGN